jgi:flagellar biosynthesis/type III secretory pathway protein FliH
MTTHKEKAIAGVEKMLQASEESLAKYNDGYREGYSDGYDEALEKAREVAEKYNLGVNEKELKPATRFLGISLGDQVNKIHAELNEVIKAVMDNEGKERIAEEIVDVQQACETALAILGLTEDERREARRKVIAKNSKREYYAPERDKYGD